MQGAAVMSCEGGVVNRHMPKPPLAYHGVHGNDHGKKLFVYKTLPIEHQNFINHRPTVPLSKHSSERNRQLLEAEDKLLCREVSASKEGTYNPGGLWCMDNPCWSRDTPEGTAAHQCPRQEQGH